MLRQDKTAVFSAYFMLVAGISAIGLLIPRDNGWMLLFAYFTSFFGYFWIVKKVPDFRELIVAGVALRVILFFDLPHLSDDLFRFIWDANLLKVGVSPYAYLPNELLSENISGITQSLFDQLNSPNYYSVYPPFNQLLFWITGVSDNWLFAANSLRSLMLVADIGSLFLIRSLTRSKSNTETIQALFFLNPLFIIEATGNLHFEGIVVFFLLLGIYFWKKNSLSMSSLGFGLAMATKLLPILFLPALLFKGWLKKGLTISILSFSLFCITLLPFLASQLTMGMSESVGLYFQNFEFNASVYFLVRAVGYWIKGYNTIQTIGPALSIVSFISILSIALLGAKKKWPLEKIMLFSLSLFLLFATTVHPWYILPLIALGLLSGFYFPIVWSLFIFVTYFGYQKSGYELSPIWLVMEYTAVLATFWIENREKINEPSL
jgi:alpha-1,6-mannosyltransferase